MIPESIVLLRNWTEPSTSMRSWGIRVMVTKRYNMYTGIYADIASSCRKKYIQFNQIIKHGYHEVYLIVFIHMSITTTLIRLLPSIMVMSSIDMLLLPLLNPWTLVISPSLCLIMLRLWPSFFWFVCCGSVFSCSFKGLIKMLNNSNCVFSFFFLVPKKQSIKKSRESRALLKERSQKSWIFEKSRTSHH